MPRFISLRIDTYKGGNRLAVFYMEDANGLMYLETVELGKGE